MIDILKKQWFVVLIALILIIFGIYVIYDTNKGKLPGKKVDGLSLVASIEESNVTADDLYNELDASVGDGYLAVYFRKAVVEQSVETTDDLKSEAKLQADQIIANYQQQYPTDYKKQIANILKNYGYDSADDLEDYMLMVAKNQKLESDYYDSKLDELFAPIYEEKDSRKVSHILIKMEDSANPTDEEAAKVKKVEEALASGTSFEDVAKEYSDDTTSAAEGGSIGYVDSESSLVKPFLEEALDLDKDEVSDWVKVNTDDSGSYEGWHIIKVTETDKTKLEEDEDIREGIYQAIAKEYESIGYEVIWQAAKKLEIEFPDESIKTRIMDYMGIEE